jgi:hypothetical protein
MKEFINDELYKEVALELGISDKVVQDVILNGQSKCTAVMIASNFFDSVRWPYLGSFKAKHKSIQILNYMKGLNPIQKEFFLESIKTGRFKKLNEIKPDDSDDKLKAILLQNGNGTKPNTG